MREFCRAGNRHNPRGFLQQPSESYLCRGHASYTAEILKHIHDAVVRTHGFGLETWQCLAVVVVRVENGVFIDTATEETTVDRAVRHEADAQLAAYIQHAVGLHVAVHQVVFALYVRQRADGMRLADGLGTDLAHAPVLHLTFLNQIADTLRHFLDRRIAVETMLVEHRNGVNAKATERFLAITADGCRTAVLTPRRFAVDDFMAEFGRYGDFALELGQRFSRKVLVGQRSVADGRIEERHATVYRLVQQADTGFFVRMLAAVVGHAHHTEAESRNLECS